MEQGEIVMGNLIYPVLVLIEGAAKPVIGPGPRKPVFLAMTAGRQTTA